MLDNIFLMSYDYYGAWDTKVGHQTALYTNGEIEGYSIDSAVQYLKNIGVNSVSYTHLTLPTKRIV